MNWLPLIDLILVLGIHHPFPAGTAVYAFFILTNNAGDGITSLTMVNFTLNRNNPELFEHIPDLTRTDIDYNQLVYSKQDLINTEHTLVISTSDVDTSIYVNFDYVIYM